MDAAKTTVGGDTIRMNTIEETLNLSVRAETILRRARIVTVEELTCCSKEDLLQLRNLGEATLWEISEILAKQGLQLRGVLEGDRRYETLGDEARAFLMKRQQNYVVTCLSVA